VFICQNSESADGQNKVGNSWAKAMMLPFMKLGF